MWVQILPVLTGAYREQDLIALKGFAGKRIQVQNNCTQYYKSYDTYVNGFPYIFLVSKKDCVQLVQKQTI